MTTRPSIVKVAVNSGTTGDVSLTSLANHSTVGCG